MPFHEVTNRLHRARIPNAFANSLMQFSAIEWEAFNIMPILSVKLQSNHHGIPYFVLKKHTLDHFIAVSTFGQRYVYIHKYKHLCISDHYVFPKFFQARNRSGQVGYVPEKYLQLPSSNSLLSMLQSLAALDARSHSSSNSTEPETELTAGTVNGDSSGKECYDYFSPWFLKG